MYTLTCMHCTIFKSFNFLDNANTTTATLTTSKPVVAVKTQAVPRLPTREKSPVATIQAQRVPVVLTQAGLGSSQSEMSQLINTIVDNGLLSYDQIVTFLMSSQQERSVVLMNVMEKIKEAQGDCFILIRCFHITYFTVLCLCMCVCVCACMHAIMCALFFTIV